MGYLALIDNREVEFGDERAVREAFRRGKVSAETWIKIADEESDWQTIEEMFPELVNAGS